MDKENSRNTIIFVVCAAALLIVYQFLVLEPAAKRRQAEQRAHAAAVVQNPVAAAAPGASVFITREQAIAAGPRAPIDSPALKGSVALKGGRIDDLYLKDYRETLAKDSPPVELFRPEGAKQAYFATTGWAGAPGAPDANTNWRLTEGDTLRPGRPITLAYDNGQGLAFTRTVAVDARYMFTVTDQVANRGPAPVTLAPYASVQRQGMPQLSQTNIIHEGAVGSVGADLATKLLPFKAWLKEGDFSVPSTGGWLGVTDKYWLAAVIPNQAEKVKSSFRVSSVNGVDVFEALYTGTARVLAPGQTSTEVSRVFAGAKKVSVLRDYQKALSIPRFDDAVDWGHFWFLTRPVFALLSFFQGLVGNFGVAILMLTVVIKAALFPLANKQFESAARMRKLQPLMEEIKKKHPDDPQKQQQETMALYQREKINPVAGCLPVLITIPIFFSLYKVLFVTIETRHAPFFGWIHDLSAPDPTTIVNLFGLIPWNPAATPLIGTFLDGPLHLGVWPLLYGFTMWLTTSMSPTPTTDPTQKLMFQFMPLLFTFFMGHFPSGLLIYYTWSNLLTILQQYVIMHRTGTENPIDSAVARFRGRTAPATG